MAQNNPNAEMERLVGTFVQIHNQLKSRKHSPPTKQEKEMKLQIRVIEEKVLEYMNQHNLSFITLDQGFLTREKSYPKPSINSEFLQNAFYRFELGEHQNNLTQEQRLLLTQKAVRFSEFVFSVREKMSHASQPRYRLKMKKNRTTAQLMEQVLGNGVM